MSKALPACVQFPTNGPAAVPRSPPPLHAPGGASPVATHGQHEGTTRLTQWTALAGHPEQGNCISFFFQLGHTAQPCSCDYNSTHKRFPHG